MTKTFLDQLRLKFWRYDGVKDVTLDGTILTVVVSGLPTREQYDAVLNSGKWDSDYSYDEYIYSFRNEDVDDIDLRFDLNHPDFLDQVREYFVDIDL